MTLPLAKINQTYVDVFALDGGSITLPDYCFVHTANKDDKRTVSSLAFLIEHPVYRSTAYSGYVEVKSIKLMFELGLRSGIEQYMTSQQSHLKNSRIPLHLGPSISERLASEGISADDAAHDVRLIAGEKEIGTLENEHGNMLCIHVDRQEAGTTIRKIRKLMRVIQKSGQLILVYDEVWLERNRYRMFARPL